MFTAGARSGIVWELYVLKAGVFAAIAVPPKIEGRVKPFEKKVEGAPKMEGRVNPFARPMAGALSIKKDAVVVKTP